MKFVADLLGFLVKIIPDLVQFLTKTSEEKKLRREERKAQEEREKEAEKLRDSLKNGRPSTMGDWFESSSKSD